MPLIGFVVGVELVIRLVMGTLAIAIWLPVSASSAEFDRLTQQVQQALLDLGYQPGPADGLFGGKTEQAIKVFQTDFRLEVAGQVTPELAEHLSLSENKSLFDPTILVLNEPGADVAARLSAKTQVEVINELAVLWENDRRRIDTVFEKPKAVLFSIFADMSPGDIVHTQIEVIREDLPKFFENTYYEIGNETPTYPFLAINEVEAGWDLKITHRLFHNGRLLSEKRTRATGQ